MLLKDLYSKLSVLRRKWWLMVAVVLIAIAFLFLYAKYTRNLKTENKVGSFDSGGQMINEKPVQQPAVFTDYLDEYIEIKSNISVDQNQSQIELVLTPESSVAEISTFSIQIIVKSSMTSFVQPIEIELNQLLLKDGWSFPVKKTEVNSDGSLTVKLAGVYLSPNQYEIDSVFKVGSLIFSSKIDDLKVEVDEEQTKIFNKQVKRYRLKNN